MNLLNSWEILLSRDYIYPSFEDLVEGPFWQGQLLCRACFLACWAIPNTVHFVMEMCRRAVVLAMSAQGKGTIAHPTAGARSSAPLLCSWEMPRLRHPSFGSVLNHNLHHKHTPKRGLIFSLHRWDRRHISRQLLLPGKHESGRLLKFLKQRNFLSSNASWMTQQPLLPASLRFIW